MTEQDPEGTTTQVPKIEVRSTFDPDPLIVIASVAADGHDMRRLEMTPVVALTVAKALIEAAEEMLVTIRDMTDRQGRPN